MPNINSQRTYVTFVKVPKCFMHIWQYYRWVVIYMLLSMDISSNWRQSYIPWYKWQSFLSLFVEHICAYVYACVCASIYNCVNVHVDYRVWITSNHSDWNNSGHKDVQLELCKKQNWMAVTFLHLKLLKGRLCLLFA